MASGPPPRFLGFVESKGLDNRSSSSGSKRSSNGNNPYSNPDKNVGRISQTSGFGRTSGTTFGSTHRSMGNVSESNGSTIWNGGMTTNNTLQTYGNTRGSSSTGFGNVVTANKEFFSSGTALATKKRVSLYSNESNESQRETKSSNQWLDLNAADPNATNRDPLPYASVTRTSSKDKIKAIENGSKNSSTYGKKLAIEDVEKAERNQLDAQKTVFNTQRTVYIRAYTRSGIMLGPCPCFPRSQPHGCFEFSKHSEDYYFPSMLQQRYQLNMVAYNQGLEIAELLLKPAAREVEQGFLMKYVMMICALILICVATNQEHLFPGNDLSAMLLLAGNLTAGLGQGICFLYLFNFRRVAFTQMPDAVCKAWAIEPGKIAIHYSDGTNYSISNKLPPSGSLRWKTKDYLRFCDYPPGLVCRYVGEIDDEQYNEDTMVDDETDAVEIYHTSLFNATVRPLELLWVATEMVLVNIIPILMFGL